MKVEQALTLLDLKDDCFHIDRHTVIKRGNTLSFINCYDNLSFAKVLNPFIKTAENIVTLTVAMPSAMSSEYSKAELDKIASREEKDSNLNKRVQRALLKLCEEKKPMPTVEGIKTLAGILNYGYDPDVVNLKFAQWGGHGNMGDSQRGRGDSAYGFSQSSDVNSFDRWQAQINIDAMLDLGHRGDPAMGFYPTEKKLESCGFFNHQYADENAAKYDMTWSERITAKNKARLIRMMKDKVEREENERNREPQKIRLDVDNYSPRHYTNLEYWLEEKRGANPEDYAPKQGRQEEWRPEWYEQLSTLRKQSHKIERDMGLKVLAYYLGKSREDSTSLSRRPNRRDMEDDPYDKSDNPYMESLMGYMAGSTTPDQIGAYGDGRGKPDSATNENFDKAEETASFIALMGRDILPVAYDEHERAQATMILPGAENVKKENTPSISSIYNEAPLKNSGDPFTTLEKRLDRDHKRKKKYGPTINESTPISDFSPEADFNTFGNAPGNGTVGDGDRGRHMKD